MAEQSTNRGPERQVARTTRGFSALRDGLMRGTVLAYALILWLAVWPFDQVPLLGDAKHAAKRLLSAASLHAGMAVFPGHTDRAELPWISCTTVRARIRRRWKSIYTPECPRKGTLFLESTFEDTVSSMMRVYKAALIQQELYPGPGVPNAVRNVVQLSDYFCHVQPDINRVKLRWVQTLRNFETGEFGERQNQYTCVSECDDSVALIPRCSHMFISRGTR